MKLPTITEDIGLAGTSLPENPATTVQTVIGNIAAFFSAEREMLTLQFIEIMTHYMNHLARLYTGSANLPDKKEWLTLAAYYFDQFSLKHFNDFVIEARDLESGNIRRKLNDRGLFLYFNVAIVLAHKFLHDQVFDNESFVCASQLFGAPYLRFGVANLNKAEANLFFALEKKLSVGNSPQFQEFRNRIQDITPSLSPEIPTHSSTSPSESALQVSGPLTLSEISLLSSPKKSLDNNEEDFEDLELGLEGEDFELIPRG